MDDLISRQALCDDLREYKLCPVPISSDESEVKGYNDGIDLAISVIAEFPSAEPVKHGKWIGYAGTIGNECSVCGKWIDVLQGTAEMNYCPNCGARMDEE